MENLIGKWGGTNLKNILLCNEISYVHPEDWNFLNDYKYIKSLHKCIGISDGYLILEFDKVQIRTKYEVFHSLDLIPEFTPLEKVKFYNSKRELEFGHIKGIHWHNNDRRFYYDVEMNGKIKGRRYYKEDLEKV